MILRRIIIGLRVAAALAATAGCDRTPRAEYDLVEAFAVADTAAERPVLDIGTPEARDHLMSGWGQDETSGVTSFVWGLGEQSELRWYLSRPMNVTMLLRGWPLVAGGKQQRVTVIVNGAAAGSLDLEPGGNRAYVLPVTAARFVAGWNRIVLRYAFHNDSVAGEIRPLAVAWDSIELRHSSHGYQVPRVTKIGEEPSLVVPPGSQIDYFLPLPAGTRLEIGRIIWPDGTEAKPEEAAFEVELKAEGAPARIVPRPNHRDSGPWQLPLDVTSKAMMRLSLRLPNGSPGDGRPLTFVRPRLRSNEPIRSASHTLEQRSIERGAGRPNVIVYLVDTLRADHLGCYGYSRDTSPRLDRFAADAVLFEHTVAQSSWTRAAVASIFTGLRAQRHGTNGRKNALSADAVTLAELLGAHGYQTVAMVTNGNVASQLGFAQGFDSYDLIIADGRRRNDSPVVTRRALDWLKARRNPRPFFLYLHTVDPHSPYDPPQPHRSRFAASVTDATIGSMAMMKKLERPPGVFVGEDVRRQLVDLYDAEIAANDESFGAFIDGLAELGLYEDSLLIFTSDHGEEFFEHGWWEHGRTLYEEQIFVPLLIKFPGRRRAGRRTDVVGCQVDLLPTILASAGAAIPSGIDGRNLLPYLDGAIDTPRDATSYLDLDGNQAESILVGRSKLIRNLGERLFPPRPSVELFDLAQDPREQSNLAWEREVTAGYLYAQLRTSAPSGQPVLSAEAPEVPEHVKEQLRALGYSP